MKMHPIVMGNEKGRFDVTFIVLWVVFNSCKYAENQRWIGTIAMADMNENNKNHKMLIRLYGATIIAINNGPIDPPKLPPTWNKDCPNPRLFFDANDVIREASGWTIEEPIPKRITAMIIMPMLEANEKIISPIAVKIVANIGLQEKGWRSKNIPTKGWNTEADNW